MRPLALAAAMAAALALTALFAPAAKATVPPRAGMTPTATGAEVPQPALVVQVSKERQEMTVLRDGEVFAVWPVSTARAGKVTPVGEWRPQSLVRFHRSRLYNGAPMPWSIFYDGHYAIHGTTETHKLGRPASAGCIRLHPDNARVLWEMVREIGRDATRVVVTD